MEKKNWTGKSLTIDVTTAARLLGVSRGTCYTAVRSGAIKSVRIGQRILIPRAEILRLVGEYPPEQSTGVN